MKILLIILIGILIIPLLQHNTKIVFVKGLHGSFSSAKKPEFSSNTWFTANFQQEYDKYYNENFGFRSAFVRLHNQINYSVFDEANANEVIIGKQRYLFGKQYIDSYFGSDFIGHDSIQLKLDKIEEIHDTLKQHETEMLIIIAPGKGFFYPEYIPDSLIIPKSTTNYQVYIDELNKRNIPFIDFNSLFLQMKDTTSIVIYPKTGIHWSQGIMPYVADSIFKKVESLLGKDIPNIYWEKGELTKQADKVDADIEKSLNLIYHIDIPKMSYPKITFENDKAKTKPKAIAIADSFWWQIFNLGVSEKVFDKGSFWYYFEQAYLEKSTPPNPVININPQAKLFQTDIVILMTTESNLNKFPFGFENILDQPLLPDSVFRKKVKSTIAYIKTDKNWLESIRKKATHRNIPLDSMLYLDAVHMVNESVKKRRPQ